MECTMKLHATSVRSGENRKTLNVEPLRLERYQLWSSGRTARVSPEKVDRSSSGRCNHGQDAGQRSRGAAGVHNTRPASQRSPDP